MKKTIIFFLVLLLILYAFIPRTVQAKCTAEKPSRAPGLFQIDVTKNSATLYFVPINGAVTSYTVAYGYTRMEDRFVVSFPSGRYDGAVNYTVNYLSPNTKYYFRMRADNGCRIGYWSDTMSVETNLEHQTYTRVKDRGASDASSSGKPIAPAGGFIASPAASFTTRVLQLPADTEVLGTSSAEVWEVRSPVDITPWWKSTWLVFLIVAFGTFSFFVLRWVLGPRY